MVSTTVSCCSSMSCFIKRQILRRLGRSKPTVGSSKNSTLGACNTPRMMSTALRIPPDKLPTVAFFLDWSSKSSSSSFTLGPADFLLMLCKPAQKYKFSSMESVRSRADS